MPFRGNQKYHRGDWLKTPDTGAFSENGNLKIHGSRTGLLTPVEKK